MITVRPYINISINSFPFRDATPVPVSVDPNRQMSADVGSVAAVGGMRITGGGRSLVRDATVDGG